MDSSRYWVLRIVGGQRMTNLRNAKVAGNLPELGQGVRGNTSFKTFVLVEVNGERHAFIGFGFSDRRLAAGPSEGRQTVGEGR